MNNTLWSSVVLDRERTVVEISNFDNRLFFGKTPMVGQPLGEVLKRSYAKDSDSFDEAIERLHRKQRNGSFVYRSILSGGEAIRVCAHVERGAHNYLVLYFVELYEDDLMDVPAVASESSIVQPHKLVENPDEDHSLHLNREKMELAIRAAEITLWEFDISTMTFISFNEPLNNYIDYQPIRLDEYLAFIHIDDIPMISEYIIRVANREAFNFNFDFRIMLPGNTEWQYCTIDGSPYHYTPDGVVQQYVGIRKNNTVLQKRKFLQDKILNSIPLSIHIKDVENDYRYTFCNDEGRQLFGTSIDNTIYEVMDNEHVERIRKTDLETFRTGEPYQGVEQIILKDGRIYDTIVRKSVIEDEGKRLLLSIRWDQSLQNDLLRRSKLLSLTLEVMEAYTWFYEPQVKRVSFSDDFEKFGRKLSDVNTLEKFVACIHPDDVQKFQTSLLAAVEQESPVWQVEFRFDNQGDGVYTWWETRGMVETTMQNDVPYKYLFGMSICVDPYKQTEQALLDNREELKKLIRQNELILNNTNSGLAYIDKNYIVQWENISICSASLSFEAYKRGEPCFQSAHNRSTPCENCVMQRAFQSRQMEQIKFSLDNDHQIEVFATPVFNDDESLDGIVVRVDDITEREKMIEELRQAKVLAEQSDKLKSAFLANMSHEIRTPLNAIVGFSDLLLGVVDEEEKEEYIAIIKNNNELLLKLINDILDLSKIEAGSIELVYEEFDLAEYFNGMILSMRQRITTPNVNLVGTNPYKKCLVNLDKNRIAQLMTNYVTNAIKFTPKGFIEMGYETVEGGIRFYVKDSGIGIPEDKKNRVFQRFAKLDEFAQGTGLGLSICKAIAESMNGHVGFDSTYQKGSLFWAFFPCDPTVELNDEQGGKRRPLEPLLPLAEHLLQSTESAVSTSFVRRTVLVAEDIRSNYLLLSNLLQKDCNLIFARNGKQAVELVRDNPIDLVLMDMKMPIMDGLTATMEIRKQNTQLPIIALTAHAFESDRLAALAAGCNEYLVKPIDKERLLEVLRLYSLLPEESDRKTLFEEDI